MIDDKSDTLCVLCQKACTGKCSWSRDLVPVYGWIAEENRTGYFVIYCPEFVKDTPETILPKDIDTDGMLLLLEAMARQMKSDYVNGYGPYNNKKKQPAEIRRMNRKLIEKDILNGELRMMLNLSNPNDVIHRLRLLAKQHDSRLPRELR